MYVQYSPILESYSVQKSLMPISLYLLLAKRIYQTCKRPGPHLINAPAFAPLHFFFFFFLMHYIQSPHKSPSLKLTHGHVQTNDQIKRYFEPNVERYLEL